MKKSVLALVLLLLVAQAPAELKMTCQTDSAGEVTVSYDASSMDPNLVRIFTLDVILDNNKIKTLETLNPHYWVYPGSIVINEATGEIDTEGSPIADRSQYEVGSPAYEGTRPGLDSNSLTIEMGSLYVGEANAPASTDDLFKFTVCNNCNVRIIPNEIRDGVVMEKPDLVFDFNSPGVGNTPAFYVSVCSCPGDIDNSGQITLADLDALVNILVTAGPPFIAHCQAGWTGTYFPCADLDANGSITLSDLDALVNILCAAGPPFVVDCLQ